MWEIGKLLILTEKFNQELIQAQAAGSQDFAFPGHINGADQEEKEEVRRRKIIISDGGSTLTHSEATSGLTGCTNPTLQASSSTAPGSTKSVINPYYSTDGIKHHMTGQWWRIGKWKWASRKRKQDSLP